MIMSMNEEYENIYRTQAIFETPFQIITEHIVDQMHDEKEKAIIKGFQEIGINPNVVIEQQKEINQLRTYIEENLKWNVVADGDLPDEPGMYFATAYVIGFEDEEPIVDRCIYINGKWKTVPKFLDVSKNVLAWMPVPEAWKGKE